MKNLVLAIGVLSCLSVPAQAAPKWVRLLSGGAVCAGSALGLATTRVGVDRGAYEMNRNISTNGRPMWGRMFAMNAGFCAGAMTLALTDRVPDSVVLSINAPLAGIRTWAGIHNIGVIRRLQPGQVK